MKKPNIVICMADQLRYDIRASKGFALDTMPFVDSLAKSGLEFDNAYTPNPTCMPARVSLFTGRVPSAHNVRTNHNAEDAVFTKDLIDVLHENGYKTALCGKNHSHLKKEDFDFWRVNGHLGIESEQELNNEEKEVDDFLKTLHFCDCLEVSPHSVKEQLPYRNVSDFFTFFDSCRKEEVPSFAWVSFAEPHNPYQVPSPYFDMFPPDMLPNIETSKEDLKDKAEVYSFAHDSWDLIYKADKKARFLRDRSNYYGMLRLIDDQIKRLFDGLKARGEMENTLVIFLSDHGEFIGEYDMIRKGCGVAEVLAHIPMIFSGYGVNAKGHNQGDFANIIDIFPTICELIGCKIPFGVQGKSLLPILQNKEYPKKDFEIAYSESGFGGLFWDLKKDNLSLVEEGATTNSYDAFDCLNTWSQAGQTRMIRKGDYKLVVNMMGQYWLYNIAKDPLERFNLACDVEYKDILSDLSLEMNSELLRKSDNIPSCKSRYRTKVHPKGYYFDLAFKVENDPGVVYFPVDTPKRSGKQ